MDKRHKTTLLPGGVPAPQKTGMAWPRMLFWVAALLLCLLLTALVVVAGTGRSKGVEIPLAFDAVYTSTDQEFPLRIAAAALPHTRRSSDAQTLVWKKCPIQKGDTLSDIFVKNSLDTDSLYRLLRTEAGGQLKRLYPGAVLHWGLREGKLVALRYAINRLRSLEFVLTDTGFVSKEVVRKPEVRQALAVVKIEDSLFVAATAAGLSHRLTMDLATIFGWDIDFVMDIRKGDTFRVLYEEEYLDDELIGYGRILAASFTNRGGVLNTVRYTDSEGSSDYYSPEGRRMRKSFIRTPVEFTRISSRFNPDRLHPVFKTRRPHRGVDYAAATGTPIRAAGRGVIHFAGRQRGYGKVVYIRHPNDIVTVYAHQSRIAAGMKKGRRVSQGQVIGYVGQTGWATGPHLHYEFRVNGRHRDPLTVKLPSAEPLPAHEMPHFKKLARVLIASLEHDRIDSLVAQDAYHPDQG